MEAKTPAISEKPDVIIDLDRLKKNCNGNTEIVKKLLLHLHQKSGPQWIADLHSGIEAGDSEKLSEICHGMKGASATLFAWRIANISLELEQLARDGNIEELSSRIVDLQAAFDECATWLKENINTL